MSIPTTKTGQNFGRRLRYRGELLAEPHVGIRIGTTYLWPIQPGQKRRARTYVTG